MAHPHLHTRYTLLTTETTTETTETTRMSSHDDQLELSEVSAQHRRSLAAHDHDHDDDVDTERGSGLRRLGHLVLHGPREAEGSEYVHVYSLAEWNDSDFWRAIVGGKNNNNSFSLVLIFSPAHLLTYLDLANTEFMATKFFVCFSILIILSAGQSMEVRV
jgi:hypothetical protein